MAAGGKHGVAAWSPDLLSGKLLWLRGDLGLTITSSHVSAWADQSGLGNNVSALGAGSTQPIPATWAAGNNAPALYWDGNDRLATVANILPTADASIITMLMVCSFDDTSAFRVPLLTSGTSGGVALAQNASGNAKLTVWKLGVAFDSDGPAVTTPLNLISNFNVGAVNSSTLYVNGVLTPTDTPTGGVLTPTGRLYVGAAVSAQYHAGYIAEILILSGTLSPADRALWNAYSFSRYGV